MAKKTKANTADKPEYPKSVETFSHFSANEILARPLTEPSCFNGMVRVVKYRITVEEVEEPIEVIHERLQKLWDESTNWHNRMPLEMAAKKYGYVFKNDMGEKKKNSLGRA